MDLLNKETDENRLDGDLRPDKVDAEAASKENVVYIDNAQLETAKERSERKELLSSGTQWADQTMGAILVSMEKLGSNDVQQILDYQQENGLYFGEAAVQLKLVDSDDIKQALSRQFGYTYNKGEQSLSSEMVMAYSPFDEQAEEFRIIRGRLLNDWLTPDQKTLAVVSPESSEGRSYVAANLALSFSQLGKLTLLIDGDLRSPRQHEIFNFKRGIGLSMLLAGRVNLEDLDALPDQISSFKYLSVLGAGAQPPNPVELLSSNAFPSILRELEKFFDVIIIDTPPATYLADVTSIASAAGNALMVVRGGHSKIDRTKELLTNINQVKAKVIGSVINQY